MKAHVFAARGAAEAAERRIFDAMRGGRALNRRGEIPGRNAASGALDEEAVGTVRWAVPRQRADTNDWWIEAPPQEIADLVTGLPPPLDVQQTWLPPNPLLGA